MEDIKFFEITLFLYSEQCRLKKYNTMQLYADIHLLYGKQDLASQIVWSIPEAATTVLCTLDDGCDGRPKHVE